MSRIDLLAVAKPSPMLAPLLEAAFNVHDRLHETDPAAFAQVAPRIRAITCGGDSRVSAELVAQLPALEIIAANLPVSHVEVARAALSERQERPVECCCREQGWHEERPDCDRAPEPAPAPHPDAPEPVLCRWCLKPWPCPEAGKPFSVIHAPWVPEESDR